MTQSTTTRLIDLRTGNVQEIPSTGGEVTATGASDLHLDLAAASILGTMRVGDDLIVNLTGGGQIIVRDFYAYSRTGDVLDSAGNQVATDADAGTSDGLSNAAKAGIALAVVGVGVALAGSGGETEAPADEPPPPPAPTAAEVALTKINAYTASSNAADTPTIMDYTTAGITGVTAGNLAAVNAAVAASDNNALTAAQVGELVTGAVNAALAAINSYDATDADAAPTLAHYATAGVAGLTEGNLAAVNAEVAVSTNDALTAMELTQLVTMTVSAALETINEYDAQNATVPTVGTYSTAGVTGVNAYNLAEVNSRVAASTDTMLTAAEVTAIATEVINEALDIINAYTGAAGSTAPTVATYGSAGVTGVTEANLAELNELIEDADPELTAATIAPLVTMANTTLALEAINAYDASSGSTAPTLETYTTAGVEGVTAGNLDAVNAAVAHPRNNRADTADEYTELVTMVIADALASLNAYDDAMGSTTPAPTLATYTTAGVDGVTAGNLAAVNAALADSENDALTADDVEGIIATVIATALAKINAHTDMSTAEQTPTLADYTTAGVTGVTATNLTHVNTRVAAADNDALTVMDVQGLVALQRINDFTANSSGEAVLVLADYTAAGITGVTEANLTAVNSAVAGSDNDALNTMTLQALVARVVALAKINAYETGDTGDDVPTLADYTAAGFMNVTEANLAGVNAQVAASTVANLAQSNITAFAMATTAALAKINNYDGDSTAAQTPTVADYTNAGVAGVETGNLSAVNMAVLPAVAGDDAIGVAAIQAAVNPVLALIKINAHDEMSTADETPTAADYTTAGFTGVNDENLRGINAQVAASDDDELEQSDIDTFAMNTTSALMTINAWDGDSDDDGTPAAPTLTDYTNAGVTGVIMTNLSRVNMRIGQPGGDVQTTAEIQTEVSLQRINDYSSSSTGAAIPSILDYTAVGAPGVTSASLDDVNAAVLASTDDSLNAMEIRNLVAPVVVLAKINAYETGDMGDAVPTPADYAAIGVTGVTAANLAAVNAAVAAAIAASTPALDSDDIQATVTVAAALAKINAYETGDTGDAVPTVMDYMNAGVAGVNADNLDDVNMSVAAETDDLTAIQIQAFAAGGVALNKINAYDDMSTDMETPTAEDYMLAGVTGVTGTPTVTGTPGTGNIDAVNDAVEAATTTLTMTTLQNLVNRVVALIKINAYTANSNTDETPVLADYTAAGVNGVTDGTGGNIADVNARVAESTNNMLTTMDVQALVALERINDYTSTSTGGAVLVLADYTAAGVTGVMGGTNGNLAALNAQVAASTDTDLDTMEIQNLVTTADALLKIRRHTTSSNDAQTPTVDDYMNAGVMGVVAANLDAVNDLVAAATNRATLTVMQIETLAGMTTEALRMAALVKINAYVTGASDDDTPTEADYMTAGVTGVTMANNLMAVNMAVATANAARSMGDPAPMVSAIQNLVRDVALAKIDAHTTGGSAPPIVQDYTNAGVMNVDADNLATVNAAVAGQAAATAMAIQALVNPIVEARTKIDAVTSASTGTALPTDAEYTTAGFTGVTATNLRGINAQVADWNGDNPNGDITQTQIDAFVMGVTDALTAINAYDPSDSTTTPNLDHYRYAGVEGATADNLEQLNRLVAGSDITTLAASDITALVPMANTATTAQVKIEAYVSTNQPDPDEADYTAVGVGNIDPTRIALLNSIVLGLNGDGDFPTTLLLLQGFVDVIAALADESLVPSTAQFTDSLVTSPTEFNIDIDVDNDSTDDWEIEADISNGGLSITYTDLDGTNTRTEIDLDRDGTLDRISYDANRDDTPDRIAYDDGTGDAAANPVADDGTIDRNVVYRIVDGGLAYIDASGTDNNIELVQVTGTAPVELDGDSIDAHGVTKYLQALPAITLDPMADSRLTINAGHMWSTLARAARTPASGNTPAVEGTDSMLMRNHELLIDGGAGDTVTLANGMDSDSNAVTWVRRADAAGTPVAAVTRGTNSYIIYDAVEADGSRAGSALIQDDVTVVLAAQAEALMIINAYDDDDNDGTANMGVTTPTEEHYRAAGVTSVTALNLDAVNAGVLAATDVDRTTPELLQLVTTLTTAARGRINAYSGSNAEPTANDYALIGVTGVYGSRQEVPNSNPVQVVYFGIIEEVNTAVQALTAGAGNRDADDIQPLVALARINAHTGTESLPTQANRIPTPEDYAAIDVTGVNENNIDEINLIVRSFLTSSGATATTAADIRTQIAIQKIENYEIGDTGDDVPTVADYVTAGIIDSNDDPIVTADNVIAVNAHIAGVADQAADTTMEIQALVDAAIAAIMPARIKINNYMTAGTNDPTVADYAAAGFSGVTEANLLGVNRRVAMWNDDTSLGDVTQTQITEYATAVNTALTAINAYDGDGTPAAPTLAQYTTAGVTGVTEGTDGNIAELNRLVARPGNPDLDAADFTRLVPAATAAVTAWGIINSYEDEDSSNGNTAPTVADYVAVGVTSVTEPNLNAVNAQVATFNTSSSPDLTVIGIENLAIGAESSARLKITSYMGSVQGAPTDDDYGAIGVLADAGDLNFHLIDGTGISDRSVSNLRAQSRFVSQRLINEYTSTSSTNTTPDVVHYEVIGVNGVTTDNLSAVNAAVLNLSTRTASVIQQRVTALIQTKIDGYETADIGSADEPTVLDYTTLGVIGVAEANLANINTRVRGLGAPGSPDRDPEMHLQPLVTGLAREKIDAYTSSSTGDDIPAAHDYVAIGVNGVTAANLVAINARVRALDTGSGNRDAADIHPLVAEQRIDDFIGNDLLPTPTAGDYAAHGITGLGAHRLSLMNELVTEVNDDPDLALTDDLIQQLADLFNYADKAGALFPTHTEIANFAITPTSITFDMDTGGSPLNSDATQGLDGRIVIALNTEGKLTQIDYFGADGTATVGTRSSRRDTFTVDSDGLRTQGVFDENGDGTADSRENYVYDADGHLIRTLNYNAGTDGTAGNSDDDIVRIDVFTVNEAGHRTSRSQITTDSNSDGLGTDDPARRSESYTLTSEGLIQTVSFDDGVFGSGDLDRNPFTSGTVDSIVDRTETYTRDDFGRIIRTDFDDGNRDRDSNLRRDGPTDGNVDRFHTYVLNANGGRLETHFDRNGDGTSDQVGYHDDGRDDAFQRVDTFQVQDSGSTYLFFPTFDDGANPFHNIVRIIGTGQIAPTTLVSVHTDLRANSDSPQEIANHSFGNQRLKHILLARNNDDVDSDGTTDGTVNSRLEFTAAQFASFTNGDNEATYEILVWGDAGDRIRLADRDFGPERLHNRWRRVREGNDQNDQNAAFLEETRMADLNGDGTMESGNFRVYQALTNEMQSDGSFQETVSGLILIHTDIAFGDISVN